MNRRLIWSVATVIAGLAAALVWQALEVRKYRRLVTTIDRALAGYAVDEFDLAEKLYFGDRRLDPKGKRYDEAARFYRRSAEKGYVFAEYRLGVLYLRGDGVIWNVTDAQKWLGRAADKKFAPAIRELGKLHFQGKFVPRDVAKGKALLIRAGKLGDHWSFGILLHDATYRALSGETRELRIEIYMWSWLAKRAGARDSLLFLHVRHRMSKADITTALRRARAIWPEKTSQ